MPYDLIILGGGPAGYHAAARAARAGLSVLLAEKGEIGGVCLNEGCIPTKTLLNSAKYYDMAKNGAAFGVTASGVTYNQSAVITRKNRVVKKLGMAIKAGLRDSGVTVVSGNGVILGRLEGSIKIAVNNNEYEGKNLLIATGSAAYIPEVDGLAESLADGFAVTSREVLDITDVPERLVVFGAGVVALEMAAYYAAVGSEVTVIARRAKIAGSLDGELSTVLMKNLEKKGVKFEYPWRVTAIKNGHVECENDSGKKSFPTDRVLVSVGRRAVTEGFGLEKLGVELTPGGAISIDGQMRTSIAGVYAAGDVTEKNMLAHLAYRQSEAAVNAILGVSDSVDYNAVPSVIYTSPEVATVGQSEDELIASGTVFTKKSLSLNFSGRYVAETERGDGFCKLLFDGSDVLIGCHILGSYASEIIMTAAILIQNKAKIADIEKYTFPHPSIVEIIKMCL